MSLKLHCRRSKATKGVWFGIHPGSAGILPACGGLNQELAGKMLALPGMAPISNHGSGRQKI
jgi:hypothetical protein